MRFFGSSSGKFKRKLEHFCNKKVEQVMTRNVVTILQDDSLLDAANIMIGQHLSCLIIVGDDYQRPLGIITERDFLLRAPTDSHKLEKTKVTDVMTRNPVSIQPELTLLEASEIMKKHDFRKLVVSKNKKLLGIITQTDLINEIDDLYQSTPFKTSDFLKVGNVTKETKSLTTKHKLLDARELMVKEQTGTCFVSKDKDLVGVFTEFDFLSELARDAEEMKCQTLGDAMSFPIMAINTEVDLFDANHLMIQKNSRRMPVLRDGIVVGKITQKIIRDKCCEIIRKTHERTKDNSLKKVNFEILKKPSVLNRTIRGKVQEFDY